MTSTVAKRCLKNDSTIRFDWKFGPMFQLMDAGEHCLAVKWFKSEAQSEILRLKDVLGRSWETIVFIDECWRLLFDRDSSDSNSLVGP